MRETLVYIKVVMLVSLLWILEMLMVGGEANIVVGVDFIHKKQNFKTNIVNIPTHIPILVVANFRFEFK